MAATKNHDYHILSIPIPGRSSARSRRFALFGGAVMWMHDNPYGKFVFAGRARGRARDDVQLVVEHDPGSA